MAAEPVRDRMACDFARETGLLTVRRWEIGVSLYLVFAGLASFFEWQMYPVRGYWLLVAYVAQVVLVLGGMACLRTASVHPRSAWVVLAANLGLVFVLALYNGAVGGDLLYLLLTFLPLLFVSSLMIPWGVGFQVALGIGMVVAHALAAIMGARLGPVPAYEYISIIATVVFSSLGAMYVDRSRRRLFEQAGALRESNQQLTSSSQARSDLLSGLSHDMRGPLNVVFGYADMLADAAVSAADADLAVRGIRREALELLSLVDGVLDLARLEVGRMPFDPVRFELESTLQPLRAGTEDLLRHRPVRLVWDIPPGLMVHSDAQKLRNVVRNLLSNAVKYTPEGEIRVSAAGAADGVQIVVADTGVGIAPEEMGRLFQAFRRGAGQASQLEPGLGFGLYTVKLLVRLAGGRIALDSEQGRGSTFRVWLPASPPPAVH